MTPEELKARTKKFAVDVIQLARMIPQDPIDRDIASQLTDAATSFAAHYRAICRAKSRNNPDITVIDGLTAPHMTP